MQEKGKKRYAGRSPLFRLPPVCLLFGTGRCYGSGDAVLTLVRVVLPLHSPSEACHVCAEKPVPRGSPSFSSQISFYPSESQCFMDFADIYDSFYMWYSQAQL